MHATGGCLLEVDELVVADESPAATAVLSEDPHTVLVEFSSVVADTQEYIIEVGMCAGVLQDGGSSRAGGGDFPGLTAASTGHLGRHGD